MTTIRFKHLVRPGALQAIGRPWLERFLKQFEPELRAQGLSLPDPKLDTEAYGDALLWMLNAPEALPDSLTEALCAIDDLAGPQGQELLERVITQAGLALRFGADSTRADIAMQVWLAAPGLLARAHNQHRLLRLTAFEHFGARLPEGQSSPFAVPNEATTERLAGELEPWFARHHRGQNTVRLELYPVTNCAVPAAEEAREYWFLIRHGDTFTRAPKVEGQRTEIIHFRPERDDVVAYSPRFDEIRINARTRGERDLYVRKFGLCLRGSEDYFSEWSTYTLEPLRRDGLDALDPSGVEGLSKVTLRELEIAWDDPFHAQTIRLADDLFKCAPGGSEFGEMIPRQGRLTRAAFALHFRNCPRPRPMQIRPPNILKLGRHCDVHVVETWLHRRGFRTRTRTGAGQGGGNEP